MAITCENDVLVGRKVGQPYEDVIRQSALGGWLAGQGLAVAFATPSIVLGLLFITVPFVVRAVEPVLMEQDPAEEEAARTLGASTFTVLRRVLLPPLAPAIISGTIRSYARALGEFGAVLVLGGAISGHTQTATTFIYNALEERQEPAAYSVAIVLALASVLLLAALEWLKRQRRKEM